MRSIADRSGEKALLDAIMQTWGEKFFEAALDKYKQGEEAPNVRTEDDAESVAPIEASNLEQE